MKVCSTLVAVVLMLSLAGPAAAQGPIAVSASKALAQEAKPVEVKTKRRSDALFWGGEVMSGVGGFMLGYGLVMKHDVSCVVLFGIVACEETGANKNMLIGTGAALTAGGLAMSFYGGKRFAVAPSRNGIVGRLRF